MKYKILLIGRNKVIIGDFFQLLGEAFEMQTSSMRHADIMSHITYFKPNAIIFCMNKEEKERIDTVMSLREGIEKNNVSLVLTGSGEECEAFRKVSKGMGDLILKKPITVRSIKDKVIEFLDEKAAAEPVPAEAPTASLKEEKEAAAQQGQQQSAQQGQQQSVQQADAAGKKHILVVDDDPIMLKVIKEQLKDIYTVATAVNGGIALKFLESKKTDLIILDYQMPNEDGAQVLEKIRQNPATAKLPVVFLTGVTEREKIRKLAALKPQGYLLKPIERETLLHSIRSIIG